MTGTSTRCAIVLSMLGVVPAAASELTVDEARRFVLGKQFSYSCFEGTSGSGRILPNGSVAGVIQIRGSGPARYVVLPAGTIGVKGDSVCAQVRGMPFQPCFNLQKTGEGSFRGSVSGLGFAYCDFNRRNVRLEVAARPRARQPLRLQSAEALPPAE